MLITKVLQPEQLTAVRMAELCFTQPEFKLDPSDTDYYRVKQYRINMMENLLDGLVGAKILGADGKVERGEVRQHGRSGSTCGGGERSPLDAGLLEVGVEPSGIPFPPKGWKIIQPYGNGYALQCGGVRVLIDCEQKTDGAYWVHVSFSRKNWTPSHEDACKVKQDFLGDRYAYAVYPPKENYVNIHSHCLHIWSRCDEDNGLYLPEFSAMVEGIGRSI